MKTLPPRRMFANVTSSTPKRNAFPNVHVPLQDLPPFSIARYLTLLCWWCKNCFSTVIPRKTLRAIWLSWNHPQMISVTYLLNKMIIKDQKYFPERNVHPTATPPSWFQTDHHRLQQQLGKIAIVVSLACWVVDLLILATKQLLTKLEICFVKIF